LGVNLIAFRQPISWEFVLCMDTTRHAEDFAGTRF